MEKKTAKGTERKAPNFEEAFKESEKKYASLEREYNKTLEREADFEAGEALERKCKNEAYAFILANGLLDKFLEFRIEAHRSKYEEKIHVLAMSADLEGLWIDLE